VALEVCYFTLRQPAGSTAHDVSVPKVYFDAIAMRAAGKIVDWTTWSKWWPSLTILPVTLISMLPVTNSFFLTSLERVKTPLIDPL
jgi:hypothetical protein